MKAPHDNAAIPVRQENLCRLVGSAADRNDMLRIESLYVVGLSARQIERDKSHCCTLGKIAT